MVSAYEPQSATISGMAKDKKPTGGEHVTKRVHVAFPEQWHAIARRLAAKRQQPVLYTLVALLIDAANEAGIGDLPAPPWEEAGDEGGSTGSAGSSDAPGVSPTGQRGNKPRKA